MLYKQNTQLNCSSYKKAASLLPKLRDKFAEFLQHGSLKRLRLLDVFTSVGLQYGEYKFQKKRIYLSLGFSWKKII